MRDGEVEEGRGHPWDGGSAAVLFGRVDLGEEGVVGADACLYAEPKPLRERVSVERRDGAGLKVGGRAGLNGDVVVEDEVDDLRIVEERGPVTDAGGVEERDGGRDLSRRASFAGVDGAGEAEVPGERERRRVVLHAP